MSKKIFAIQLATISNNGTTLLKRLHSTLNTRQPILIYTIQYNTIQQKVIKCIVIQALVPAKLLLVPLRNTEKSVRFQQKNAIHPTRQQYLYPLVAIIVANVTNAVVKQSSVFKTQVSLK